MKKALYRKYRSITLDDIVGQDQVISALRNALKTDRISHAYLFTGPRGVGKTSVARILAHEINNIPYTNENNHIDIIEIDAASNGNIDQIRDLKEKVNIAPSIAKYKIYIIDEVHMVSKPAFNALLKTLEEPPTHVIFILATTDIDKLPLTIISRTQRYNFKPITTDQVFSHLKNISEKENINITDDAIIMIAKYGDGSLRDSISALDLVANQVGLIDSETVAKMIGWPPLDIIDELGNQILNQTIDIAQILSQLNKLYDQGYQAIIVANQLSNFFKEHLIENDIKQLSTQQIINILKKLLDINTASDPERYLEIILIDVIINMTSSTKNNINELISTSVDNTRTKKKNEAQIVSNNTISEIHSVSKSSNSEEELFDYNDSTQVWNQLLAKLKISYNTLYGIVKMADPIFKNDGSIELIFKFAFHQKRLKEAKNNLIISEILFSITGKKTKISYLLSDKLTESHEKNDIIKSSLDDISSVTNVFKGAELLE